MPIRATWSDGPRRTLGRILRAATGAGSEAMLDRVETALVDGNADDRLRGVDRAGRPVAALRSRRKGPYAGATGPPLVPFGRRSRFIRNFAVARSGRFGARTLTAGWSGLLTKSGLSLVDIHGDGKGRNPVRDARGASPRTWARVRAIFHAWVATLSKGG